MNIWDDATQEKLNAEPIRVTAFDGEEGPLVGSGLYRTREEQIEGLAFQTAQEVEELLEDNIDTWFAPKEGRERTAYQRDPETGLTLVVDEDAEAPPPADGLVDLDPETMKPINPPPVTN